MRYILIGIVIALAVIALFPTTIAVGQKLKKYIKSQFDAGDDDEHGNP